MIVLAMLYKLQKSKKARKAVAGLQSLAVGLIGILIALYVASQVGANLSSDPVVNSTYTKIIQQFETWTPIVFIVAFAIIVLAMFYKLQKSD